MKKTRIEPASRSHLPVPTATSSYWRQQKYELDGYESVQPLPLDCDILIIGGGYAGIATAYHLLKSNHPPSKIILLEARAAGSGATGRNGGHLRPDHVNAAVRSYERYGPLAASDVVRFEAEHLRVLRNLIQDEEIDCDFCETTSFQVLTTAEQVAVAQAKYNLLSSLPAFETVMADVELYVGDDAPGRTGLVDAKGYFATPAAHLSPYKLIMTLLARCLQLGLRLKAHTPVLSVASVKTSVGGQGHRITTSEGEITARKLVFATNAYTSVLLPEYSAAIVPCKGLVCHISGSDGCPLPRLSVGSFTILEQGEKWPGYTYIIQQADNTLVVGGAHHTYKEELGSWYMNADDGQLIEPARNYFQGYMQRAFAGWEHSQAQIDHIWTGIMGYSADSLPHVGQVPGRDEAFILAGFDGHGMPVAFLAARCLAEMVGQGKSYEETGLPTLYQTSHKRLSSTFDDILQGRGAEPLEQEVI
jgi:glycine/D-amino acid oxidase-like deaminating enzyme